MSCSRCCGLMIKDHYMDHEGTSGYSWMSAWRCMNCGHVHDATIEQNRRSRRVEVPVAALVCDESDYADAEVHLGAETIVAQAA
jgi:uncharacterized Zn finger protein